MQNIGKIYLNYLILYILTDWPAICFIIDDIANNASFLQKQIYGYIRI